MPDLIQSSGFMQGSCIDQKSTPSTIVLVPELPSGSGPPGRLFGAQGINRMHIEGPCAFGQKLYQLCLLNFGLGLHTLSDMTCGCRAWLQQGTPYALTRRRTIEHFLKYLNNTPLILMHVYSVSFNFILAFKLCFSDLCFYSSWLPDSCNVVLAV